MAPWSRISWPQWIGRSREPSRPALGDRRAPGGEQDRHVLARGVEQAHERVGHADVDVDHDRLRPAGGEVVAVRHADRDRLVRGGERLGHREPGGGAARERLDHRREVGAGVGEQPVDPARLEQRRDRPRRRSGFFRSSRPPDSALDAVSSWSAMCQSPLMPLVGTAGVEPARPEGHWILSPMRLPVPPRPPT